jgi:hypothetical protein
MEYTSKKVVKTHVLDQAGKWGVLGYYIFVTGYPDLRDLYALLRTLDFILIL